MRFGATEQPESWQQRLHPEKVSSEPVESGDWSAAPQNTQIHFGLPGSKPQIHFNSHADGAD